MAKVEVNNPEGTYSHILIGVFLMILGFVLVFMGMFIQATQEAKTFNRMTGGNATVWDAMFSELRVIGEAK